MIFYLQDLGKVNYSDKSDFKDKTDYKEKGGVAKNGLLTPSTR